MRDSDFSTAFGKTDVSFGRLPCLFPRRTFSAENWIATYRLEDECCGIVIRASLAGEQGGVEADDGLPSFILLEKYI